MHNLLTRKEVCSRHGIHRSTLHRWQQQGLLFLRGRISEADFAFFLELAEAAKTLGMTVSSVMMLDRPEKEKMLQRALYARCAGKG